MSQNTFLFMSVFTLWLCQPTLSALTSMPYLEPETTELTVEADICIVNPAQMGSFNIIGGDFAIDDCLIYRIGDNLTYSCAMNYNVTVKGKQKGNEEFEDYCKVEYGSTFYDIFTLEQADESVSSTVEEYKKYSLEDFATGFPTLFTKYMTTSINPMALCKGTFNGGVNGLLPVFQPQNRLII